LCSTTSTPPSITDKRAQQRLCYSTSGTTAVRHAPLTPWDSHCKWGHGLSANAYSTTRWASQSPVDNETADVPETEANPSGPQTDTKTGPQISNSPRQRLTPHHVQLPSPQIDPYREQTKGTPLHPVSVPSASILLLSTTPGESPIFPLLRFSSISTHLLLLHVTPGGASAPELRSPETVVDLYPDLPGQASRTIVASAWPWCRNGTPTGFSEPFLFS
jgi:hypothetical protein